MTRPNDTSADAAHLIAAVSQISQPPRFIRDYGQLDPQTRLDICRGEYKEKADAR